MIRASKARIWGPLDGCPGSVKMAAAAPPPPDNEYSRDGIEAHDLAARMIRSFAVGGKDFPEHSDEEMFEAALLYASDVRGVMQSAGAFSVPALRLEELIPLERIHKDLKGRVDCSIYDKSNKTLYIWDFKYGHSYVDVWENPQLVAYASGVLDLIDEDWPNNDIHTDVVFRIVQPRCFTGDAVEEWRAKAWELRPFVNQLHAAAREALGDNPMLRTGDHCKRCPALFQCPAALKQAGKLIETVERGISQSSASVDDLALRYAIAKRAQSHVKNTVEAIEEQLIGRLRQGERVPGYTLTDAYGREEWSVPAGEVFKLGEAMGVTLQKPAAITPNQARKAGLDDSLLKIYVHRPKKGLKLVEHNETEARRIFQ